MQTTRYDGTTETKLFDTEEELAAAVEQAIKDPDIKTIRIKRLTGSQKRKARREQHALCDKPTGGGE